MAVVNQYKAIYPIENSFENEIIYINATSMEKAIEMLKTEKAIEPKLISLQHENILTEFTEETFVNFEIKSYYNDGIDDVEIPQCTAYPTILTNCKRGDTLYMQAPNYSFIENGIEVTYTFDKWMYEETEYTENPQIITIPLDESVTIMTVKAIYSKTTE